MIFVLVFKKINPNTYTELIRSCCIKTFEYYFCICIKKTNPEAYIELTLGLVEIKLSVMIFVL